MPTPSWTLRAARIGGLLLLLLLSTGLPGAAIAGHPAPQPLAGIASLIGEEPYDYVPKGGPPSEIFIARVIGQEAKPPVPAGPVGPVTYVPILYYHYIRVNPNPSDRQGFSLSTTPSMFHAQMQYLADRGFHVLRLHDAVVAIRNHAPLPPRPVVLTFDDGYADFFTVAVPELRSHNFTATDFVITGRMGWSGFLSPAQVAAADGMGFTIGAHTVDHVALAAQAPARALWEMRQSQQTLETLLGHPVLDFAYPYGSFNSYDMAQATALGFETAVSTIQGTLHWPGQLMNLYRVRIGGGLGLRDYAGMVGGPPPTAAEIALGGAPYVTPSPTPTSTPSPTPTPTPTPSPSPTPSPTH